MVAVDLGLFFLIAEPGNLVSDGIVALLVVGLPDELLFQFFQPALNAVRRESVGADYGLDDVRFSQGTSVCVISKRLTQRQTMDLQM